MSLTAKQRAALEAVRAGRVGYGDPYPAQLARRVKAAQRRAAAGETVATSITGRGPRRPVPTDPRVHAVCVFLLDGSQLAGGAIGTYASLSMRELIDAVPNDDGTVRTVTLTAAGEQALR